MTDPTGFSFLSYRRSRSTEAAMLVRAQHVHGVPTWQDVDDLDNEPTEDALERVLADPSTADVLLWVTPDVKGSAVIRRIEALERTGAGQPTTNSSLSPSPRAAPTTTRPRRS